ncbi:MAG: hypothetical protein JJ863_06315 [Deltaproteobacteria bacterium]|nr:hypothetical protein [Deltaproteobacteria bacterium]
MPRPLFIVLLWLAACGGQTVPAETGDGSAGCPYTLDDPCIDDDALAQCDAAYAECAGDVSVLESCPLQFACP